MAFAFQGSAADAARAKALAQTVLAKL